MTAHCEIALMWMAQNLTHGKSILAQVMAWCHQATSHYHYLSQCWPGSVASLGYNELNFGHTPLNPCCFLASWTGWLIPHISRRIVYSIDLKLNWCIHHGLYQDTLTLNVRGPSYLGLTRSISWLLMPWLLTSPGHQQPWYWLCRIGRFLSYLKKDFNYLRRINVAKWHKM